MRFRRLPRLSLLLGLLLRLLVPFRLRSASGPRRPFLLTDDAVGRQPGVGTVGVIGASAVMLLGVAVLAVPSAARRADLVPAPAPQAAPDGLLPAPASMLQPSSPPARVGLSMIAPKILDARQGGVVSARSEPAAEGRLVVFEALADGRWQAVASAREDAGGNAVARVLPVSFDAIAGGRRIFGAIELRARIAGVVDSPTVRTVRLRPNARLITWRAWIEKPSWDGAAFAAEVERVLTDPRGWGATGEVWFRRIESGTPRMWAKLATPRTTDRLCAPTQTRGVWNCRAGNSIVVNADRWFEGRASWPGAITDYRALIVNHETGHVLGFAHAGCPGRGLPAPVMQQQGVSLGGCRPNPWPVAGELARLS